MAGGGSAARSCSSAEFLSLAPCCLVETCNLALGSGFIRLLDHLIPFVNNPANRYARCFTKCFFFVFLKGGGSYTGGYFV